MHLRNHVKWAHFSIFLTELFEHFNTIGHIFTQEVWQGSLIMLNKFGKNELKYVKGTFILVIGFGV